MGDKKVGLVPYGPVSEVLMDSLASILEREYRAEVIVLPQRELPASAFVNVKSPRYRADSLLIDLLRIRPNSIDHLLGITRSDISTSKRDADGKIKDPEYKYADWGIFGLAQRPGRSAVI